jgi:hypothetical protein
MRCAHRRFRQTRCAQSSLWTRDALGGYQRLSLPYQRLSLPDPPTNCRLPSCNCPGNSNTFGSRPPAEKISPRQCACLAGARCSQAACSSGCKDAVTFMASLPYRAGCVCVRRPSDNPTARRHSAQRDDRESPRRSCWRRRLRRQRARPSAHRYVAQVRHN